MHLIDVLLFIIINCFHKIERIILVRNASAEFNGKEYRLAVNKVLFYHTGKIYFKNDKMITLTKCSTALWPYNT